MFGDVPAFEQEPADPVIAGQVVSDDGDGAPAAVGMTHPNLKLAAAPPGLQLAHDSHEQRTIRGVQQGPTSLSAGSVADSQPSARAVPGFA